MAAGEYYPPGPVAVAGWQCPACRMVWGPTITGCPCSLRTGFPAFPLSPQPFPLRFSEPRCTCPQAWGGIMAPPACPAHGRTEMTRITC